MIINHNISALNTYNRLMLNNAGITKSLEKLSSGMRINRAADDAAGLAISEKMRSQIRGMEQAQRNAQDGISIIQTAEGALSETHSILQRMRELAVQAANDTYTSNDRLNIQSEIDQLTAEIDRIATSTQFNGKNLLDGSTAALVSSDKLTTKIFMRDGLRVLDQFGQKSAGGGNYRLDIQTAAGANQVQKSDIFKVKHNTNANLCFEVASGITNFTSTTAPAGTYKVDTVDISSGAVTCARTAGQIVGETTGRLCIEMSTTGAYAGTAGNCIQICLKLDAANTNNVIWDEAAKVLTIEADATANSVCFDVIATCITNLLGAANVTVYSLGTNCTVASTLSFSLASGTDIVKANSSINGQYQSNTANGKGLIERAILADTSQVNNASMYFEVLCIDTTNDQIGVRVYSHQYNACGAYSAYQQDITLLTGEQSQTGNINIGAISFTAACFVLANTDHFSVGDKFAIDVTASQAMGKDKLVVRNDSGSTKEFLFENDTWNNSSGTCILRAYYLNNTSGEVKSACFNPTFTTYFCEYTGIQSFTAGAGITAVVGDDLEEAMNWSVTGCTALANDTVAHPTVEKIFSTCGSVQVSGIASCINSSLLFTVTGVCGTAVQVDIKGTAILLTGAYCDVNTFCIFTSGAASATFDFGEVGMNLAISGTWQVGDKFTTFQSGDAAADDDALIFSKQQRELTGGCLVAGTSVTRSLTLGGGIAVCLNVNFMELNATTGESRESNFVLTRGAVAAGSATFQTTDTNAASYKQALSIGDVARLETQLYDVDKFWDGNGNFILENPKTITLVQGDGKKASITISAADTFQTVRDKLNNAIAVGLEQGTIVGAGNEGRFVSFVEMPTSSGMESVKGTFVIRSAIAGKNGEINVIGDDATLAALSLATIQKATSNSYRVDVTEAHAGCLVAGDVKLADNNLIGVIHKNVDVQFAANTGLKVTWNETTKDFSLLGGTDNYCSTFVHLADRTMVFQIGANQKQDVGAAVGNMGVYALGLENIQVTTNTYANEALGKIDVAINRVSTQRATLGAIQNRLDHSISSLATTTENLTAAESRIRDVDMAKQMMEFTKFNILSQASTAMLAQANQLPQTVLQLLK